MTKPPPRAHRVFRTLRHAVLKPTGIPRDLNKQAEQIRGLRAELAEVMSTSRRRDIEHSRVTVQMGAFEERVGRMEELLATGTFVADDDSLTEARSLVDTIRREHEQARVRMQIVSHYEERLRRVEEALAKLYDGDVRHQV